MTRLGGVILALIVLVAIGFGSMLRFGGPPASKNASVPDTTDAGFGSLAVPVAGVPRGALRDSWGDAREGGERAHHGTDIVAPGGTPVLAAAAGTVEKLFQSRLGGTTLYIRSPDRRWTYYYAHLSGYAAGMREGLAVRRGQPIAFVGDTGDAGAGNYHLHFGLSRTTPQDGWWQGRDVDPYPLLAGTAAPR